MKNLIKKGFAWAILDANGELVDEDVGGYLVYSTKDYANDQRQQDANERVIKVKIEVIK